MLANLFKSRNLSNLVKILLFFLLLSSKALSQSEGFGSLVTDRTEPIEFNSERLIFNQEKNLAELFDRVKITQGRTILSAKYVKAIYSKYSSLETVYAEGNVELKSDQDIARADEAIYSLTNNSISLTGNAKLIQGENHLMANQILINTETGLTQLLGSVTTIISPSID
tara:strand:- start:647 stop:1153 length:507 start_codon:yes stop_codon:yes gene_type:complete